MAEYKLGGREVSVDLWLFLASVKQGRDLGFTQQAIAAQCGVSERTLRRLLIGKRVSARTMDKVLTGLDLDAADVITYLKAGGKNGEEN